MFHTRRLFRSCFIISNPRSLQRQCSVKDISVLQIPHRNLTELIDPSEIDGRCRIAEANSFQSWNALTPVKLQHIENNETAAYPPFTVQQNLRRSAMVFGDSPALTIKRNSTWVYWNYSEYLTAVETTAKGFLALDLKPGESVGIMGHNSPEWLFASLGAIFAGGLGCGIYTTASGNFVTYLMKESNAKLLVLENDTLLNKVLNGRTIAEAFPLIRKVILLENNTENASDDERIMTWKSLQDLGRRASSDALHEAERNQAVNCACLLIYTSGTTGRPKGVLLSHDNLTWSSKAISCVYKPNYSVRPQETVISFLPLSHVAAYILDVIVATFRGGLVHFADKDAFRGSLAGTIKEVEPKGFLAVPRVYEKMHQKVMSKFEELPPLKKSILEWARTQALEHQTKIRRTKSNCQESISYRLAKLLLHKFVHKQIGLHKATIINTGAPLPAYLIDFYDSVDMPLGDIYGTSETSGSVTIRLSGAGKNVLGNTLPGIDCQIRNPDENGSGELVVKGRNVFMGYLHEETATREAFTSDGFFRSGDLVKLDDQNYRTLDGRIKDIIITAGGKNVSVNLIESSMGETSLNKIISNFVIIGDGKPYLIALLTPKVIVDLHTLKPTNILETEVRNWCESVLGSIDSIPETVEDFIHGPHSKRLHEVIDNIVEKEYNEYAESSPFRIRKWKMLPKAFSVDGGELGPTLKLKRSLIAKLYEKEIAEVYGDKIN